MATTGTTTFDKIIEKEPKRKYLVIDSEENVEYIIKTKTNKKGQEVYKLFYSKADFWKSHVKCKLRIKMTNLGDGYSFKFDEREDLSKLDYAELECLRILVNFESDSAQETKHTIVEVKSQI
jgi:hypothetical protein